MIPSHDPAHFVSQLYRAFSGLRPCQGCSKDSHASIAAIPRLQRIETMPVSASDCTCVSKPYRACASSRGAQRRGDPVSLHGFPPTREWTKEGWIASHSLAMTFRIAFALNRECSMAGQSCHRHREERSAVAIQFHFMDSRLRGDDKEGWMTRADCFAFAR